MASVSRKNAKGRAERRRALSLELLAVAEELLADGGSFAELSIARLIEHAGISRTTFYVYFEDRSSLLTALGESVVDDVAGAAAAWGELGETPTRDEIAAAVAQVVDAYGRHRVVLSALAESAGHDTAVREQLETLLARQSAALAEHITRGREAGAIRREIDVDRVAAWIVWMTDRGTRELVLDAKPAARRKLLQTLAELIHRTLYRTAP